MTSEDVYVEEYFRERNRLLSAAANALEHLPEAIASSPLSHEALFGCLPEIVVKVLREHSGPATARVLDRVCAIVTALGFGRELDAALKRVQVVLGHRPMSIGIYDHALQVVGGGQKYVATLAASLQERFDVTYIVNCPVDLEEVGSWYGLDLSRCRTLVVPLPFYADHEWIDSTKVGADEDNPFDAVARASAAYDVFINANMLEKVRPLAPLSVFFCHFPDVLPRAHFAAHEYTLLVANSRYTSDWVRRRWGLAPSMLLYPPIDAAAPGCQKERIILSVARFEPGGSKKQLEMIQAFRALRAATPESVAGWRLVLVGGSLQGNAYLDRVRSVARRESGAIEVHVNVPFEQLRSWYGRASIFWHACGFGERDPHLIEHFGMSTVEAMQNRCAPIVFDGGGQREIVEHGISGFRFQYLDELCAWTAHLAQSSALRSTMQDAARRRSAQFDRATFEARGRGLFDLLHREYATLTPPDSDEVRRILRARSAAMTGRTSCST